MRCVKPSGSTVPYLVTRLSKSANACGEQSEGESMDEVTIALFCGMNLGDRRTVARMMATTRMILSLPREAEKSQNPAHMKTKTLSLVLIPLLAYFSAFPTSQAVTPAPDGAYPGRNTAEGHKALFSLTTGTDNTALGWLSLQALTTGKLNTGVGAWTLALNTSDYNTACGAAALLFNGTGFDNTAVGTAALLFNTIGEGNTATGAFALYSNTEGDFNTGKRRVHVVFQHHW